jgi:hypothetical protein
LFDAVVVDRDNSLDDVVDAVAAVPDLPQDLPVLQPGEHMLDGCPPPTVPAPPTIPDDLFARTAGGGADPGQ